MAAHAVGAAGTGISPTTASDAASPRQAAGSYFRRCPIWRLPEPKRRDLASSPSPCFQQPLFKEGQVLGWLLAGQLVPSPRAASSLPKHTVPSTNPAPAPPSPVGAETGPGTPPRCWVLGQAAPSGAAHRPVHSFHASADVCGPGTLSPASMHWHLLLILLPPLLAGGCYPVWYHPNPRAQCHVDPTAGLHFPARKVTHTQTSPRFSPPNNTQCYRHPHQRPQQPSARCCGWPMHAPP